MKRSLAVTAALLLTALAGGCGADDEPDGSASASDDAGEVGTHPRGADVTAFCDVLTEIDDAIDDARPGSDEDWQRILAAFDDLDALGVPDDLPESAGSELVHVELLARRSGSTEEFTDAVEASPPASNTVDTYIDDHC